MTNVKMTIRDDYTVSACNHPPPTLSIKVLTPCLSGSWPLDRHLPPSPCSCRHLKQSKFFLSTNLAHLVAFEWCAARPFHAYLLVTLILCSDNSVSLLQVPVLSHSTLSHDSVSPTSLSPPTQFRGSQSSFFSSECHSFSRFSFPPSSHISLLQFSPLLQFCCSHKTLSFPPLPVSSFFVLPPHMVLFCTTLPLIFRVPCSVPHFPITFHVFLLCLIHRVVSYSFLPPMCGPQNSRWLHGLPMPGE